MIEKKIFSHHVMCSHFTPLSVNKIGYREDVENGEIKQ